MGLLVRQNQNAEDSVFYDSGVHIVRRRALVPT